LSALHAQRDDAVRRRRVRVHEAGDREQQEQRVPEHRARPRHRRFGQNVANYAPPTVATFVPTPPVPSCQQPVAITGQTAGTVEMAVRPPLI
jgi:hypothetical protein